MIQIWEMKSRKSRLGRYLQRLILFLFYDRAQEIDPRICTGVLELACLHGAVKCHYLYNLNLLNARTLCYGHDAGFLCNASALLLLQYHLTLDICT